MGPEITISLPDGSTERLLKMRARPFQANTVVETKTGGGGGNGDSLARPFPEVLKDVRYGYLSREAALADYGVAIGTDMVVDEAASTPRA
jgi:N-methylhydantoinase B